MLYVYDFYFNLYKHLKIVEAVTLMICNFVYLRAIRHVIVIYAEANICFLKPKIFLNNYYI